MVRTLRSAGVDMHALAARVEQKTMALTEAEMTKIFDAGFEHGRATGYRQAITEIEDQKKTLRFHDVGGEEASAFHAMAIFCQRNYCGGNSKERQFVEHMVNWTKRREPTDRQAEWLEDIYQRLGGT
jgi:hypothetical protein